MSETKRVEYKVKGSALEPYTVVFTAKNGTLSARCSCPSGQDPRRIDQLCKHRRELLNGQYGAVVGRYWKLPGWMRALPLAVPSLPTKSAAALAVNATAHPQPTQPIRTALAVCIDVETTGPVAGRDAILELAAVLFRYDVDRGEVLGQVAAYASLQDTTVPIHREAAAKHCLTREHIAGHQIDWLVVQGLIARAEVIVAHNAQFDRGFLMTEPKLSIGAKTWLCTQQQISWRQHGFASQALEALAKAHGIPHTAHRALGDTQALVNLLGLETPAGGTYLGELLRSTGKGKRRH